MGIECYWLALGTRSHLQPACTWGNSGEGKCVCTHEIKPVGLQGGEVGHDKHTFNKKIKK